MTKSKEVSEAQPSDRSIEAEAQSLRRAFRLYDISLLLVAWAKVDIFPAPMIQEGMVFAGHDCA